MRECATHGTTEAHRAIDPFSSCRLIFYLFIVFRSSCVGVSVSMDSMRMFILSAVCGILFACW